MSFEIKVAQRHGTRLLIQLAGESGDGKTYTALLLAYGLAGGKADKIVGIDTENRRMQLYADILPSKAQFRTIEFYAPFSPDRYIEAIDAACKGGAEVIVIDTVSYEWAGIGGCLEIAEKLKGPQAQKASKTAHRKFMNHMIQCPAHIIVCTRAKEKFDWSDPSKPKRLGVGPIQESEFGFECTVSLLMQEGGQRQHVMKCPGELMEVMGRGDGYIGIQEGQQLRAWVDGGVQIDPALEAARGSLLNVTEKGLEAFKEAWNAQSPAIRKALGQTFRDQCAASAAAYDKQRSGEVLAEVTQLEQNPGIGSLNEAAETVDTSAAIPAIPETANMVQEPSKTEPASEVQKTPVKRNTRAKANPEPEAPAEETKAEPAQQAQAEEPAAVRVSNEIFHDTKPEAAPPQQNIPPAGESDWPEF